MPNAVLVIDMVRGFMDNACPLYFTRWKAGRSPSEVAYRE
jgi:hypothetical protein